MSGHTLAPILDTAAADPLRLMLLQRVEARQPLLLDGAEVAQAGQACLQVLASARSTAAAEGLAFAVGNPSDALRAMAALARLDAVLDPVG